MVIFNELRITEDGSCLIADCQIANASVFSEMYIDKILLVNYNDAVLDDIQSSKHVVIFDGESVRKRRSRVRLYVEDSALTGTSLEYTGFKNGLFYVVVLCTGEMQDSVETLASGTDSAVGIGVVPDWKVFYEKGMQYVSYALSGAHTHKFAKGFEDYILLWNAFKLSISTGDLNSVSKLWAKFLRVPFNLPQNLVAPAGLGPAITDIPPYREFIHHQNPNDDFGPHGHRHHCTGVVRVFYDMDEQTIVFADSEANIVDDSLSIE